VVVTQKVVEAAVGRSLTSACSVTPAGLLAQRSRGVHHRAMQIEEKVTGVPLKRGVRPMS